jgi:ComF family protein
VSASYEKTAKELVRKLKFARAQSAAKDIAAIIDENLPILPGQTIITHLPTASSRIRVRGYDQAQAIAKALAKRRGLPYMALLGRKGSARQVGASRTSRFEQLQGVFFAKNAKNVSGAHILLVDDVLTTGASVESAAARLKASGAKTVDVAVFAQP